jgi:hypothetical protein
MVQDLELIEIRPCKCYSTALQLLERGLFPCSPSYPSLAVSLNVLEFVQKLFIRMPPNTTAWCETLEDFLGGRGYKLTTMVCYFKYLLLTFLMRNQDTLRRRFSKTMQWFSALVNATAEHVKNFIDSANLSSHVYHDSMASPPGATLRTADNANLGLSETQLTQDVELSRPSPYLRARCPLCFGGSHAHVNGML